MPQDAPPNGSAQGPAPEGPWSRVAGMQAKLHRWAAADPGRRFDDLFNFVHDPATLYVAYCRVEGNRGANTPGVDGMTVRLVGERTGVREFLDDLRAQPVSARWPRATGQTGTVPVFTVVRSAEEEPGCVPAASPRVRRRPSPWPTDAR